MHIIRDPQYCPESSQNAVIALGNFDGVHRGHQAILKCCAEIARGEGCEPTAMTFEPHPREFFSTDKKPLRIYPFRRKAELLKEYGMHTLFCLRFGKRLAATSAASFIEDILHRQLKVRHVVTGYNFAFGKGRSGNTEFLTHEAHRLGFGFTALPQVEDEGDDISSSAIREALAQGNTQKVSHMLGRPYVIEGRVQKGEQRGRQIGFPTANIRAEHLFLPRFGVYAARVTMGGRRYDAVANLGIKPTFGQQAPLLEAHFFDIDKSMYGEKISVELLEFIRPEEKFPGIDALRNQIEQDATHAKRLLAGVRS